MAIIVGVYNKYWKETNTPEWIPNKYVGTKIQDSDGSIIELFKRRVLADALNRKADVIKQWEKKKWVPPAIFRIQGDQCTHWYSSYQVVNAHRLMYYKYDRRKYLNSTPLFEEFLADLRRVWYCREVVVNEEGQVLL